MRILSLAVAAALAGCGAQHLPATTIPGALPGAVTDSMIGPAVFAHHLTFRYVGKPQQFTVPKKTTHLSIIAIGGRGGGETGSFGGRVSAIISVYPGESLTIRVGGNGAHTDGGFNGGGKGGYYGFSNDKRNGYGGGGATDIREYGDLLQDRVLVAGGGGGQGGSDDVDGYSAYGVGGKGGALIGGPGASGYPQYKTYACLQYPSCGGKGGTQGSGGAGGFGGDGDECHGTNGLAGSLGIGGRGAKMRRSGSVECGGLGGGGGGGYYGGGGGGQGAVNSSNSVGGGAGGGGGSSYVEHKATDVHMWHGWTKNQYGLVVIRWS